MPSRPDIREIATNVKDAFADADRETLLDVLTFVVKEYVVEGPPPMLLHQAETLKDLQGVSFAQLITALQTRFDHPELAMFVVDGEQVGVRMGGVVQPLLPGRTAPAADLPRPSAGVRVVETTLAPLARDSQGSQRPPAPAQPPPAAPARAEGQAPPPVRGISLSGRPAGVVPGSGTSPAPQRPPAEQPQGAAPAATPPPAAAPAEKEKPEGGGDDAAARFSLLELD